MSPRHRQWLLSVLATASVTLLAGCNSCTRGQVLAVLESKVGRVQHHVKAEGQSWKEAPSGDQFEMGDAVRTLHDSTAQLGLDDGSKLRVQKDTTIRFSKRPPTRGSQAIEIESGEVLLEVAGSAMDLVTQIGKARIEAHSVLVLRHTNEGIRFEVSVGQAELEGAEGPTRILPGHFLTASLGAVVLETANQPIPSAAVAVATATSGLAPEALPNDVGVRVSGSRVRQKGPKDTDYRALIPGTTSVPPGSELKVGSASHVELKRGDATVTLSEFGTYVVNAEKEALATLRSGKMALRGATRIRVPGGTIETASGSAVEVATSARNQSVVHVVEGSATFLGAKGPTKLVAGEQATVSLDGSAVVDGRSLPYADVSLEAGQSAIIHDPAPPTAIRFRFGTSCASGGEIRLQGKSGGRFATGESATSMAFASGRYAYTLHCRTISGVDALAVSSGTVTVVRDAGTRPVPKTPPTTQVSIDGHNYTVMYQNQLPNLTVTWPQAPSAATYRLVVESRGNSTTRDCAVPTFTFRSGTLAEGHHDVHFEGGSKVSRHTGVDIVFDNAAPMANLTMPMQLAASDTGDVTVSGTAQPGWVVDVGGSPIAQDEQQRFSQPLKVPSGERALAVRLVHPTRGTHIYLRRLERSHE